MTALTSSPFGFNPHRPRRAGATMSDQGYPCVTSGFQSSPAPKGRCYYIDVTPGTHWKIGFNPHRPRRAGATSSETVVSVRSKCFNPHRPRRAGATLWPRSIFRFMFMFQSSPAPKGRCYPGVFAGGVAGSEVSILTGPEGPVLRCKRPGLPQRLGCFNPHRPRRAGATIK